jgi:aldehyde:ferredoxin oxidoreductase
MIKDYGTALRIDLSNKKTAEEKLGQDLLTSFIGGKGFAATILYNELPVKADPLGPDNILVIAVGPLTGTNAPAFSKTAFATKSPLTGMFIDSYVGGSLGPELRFAGYELVIIKGRAERPVYVYIEDGKVKIEDASDLWGKDVAETEQALKHTLGEKVQIASIGPAGENLVNYACVCHQIFRQSGRGGIGAVMGSKNLKAVVVRGSGKVTPSNETDFAEAVREANEIIRANPIIQDGLAKFGTLNMVPMAQGMGIATVRNYSSGIMEKEVAERLSGPEVESVYKPKKLSCFRCPIGCARRVELTDSKGNRFETETEFETLILLGPNMGITDYDTIAYLGSLCDRMGLDTIQTGNALSFAMECYEKGLISDKDTEGIQLYFGNKQAAIELINNIAYKKGFGRLLAQGVREAAETIGKGSQKFAMHVKGLGFPAAWDVRGAQGHGFSFAVSDRGACHLSSDADFAEFLGGPGIADRFSLEGKPNIVKDTEDLATVRETLISCIFNFLPLETHLMLLNSALGISMSKDEFLLVGERIEQLIRAFNVREAGISRKDDTLPGRIFEEPIPEGPSEGHKVNKEEFEKGLDIYYRLREWNNDGVPVKSKLNGLGLEKAAEEIGKSQNA